MRHTEPPLCVWCKHADHKGHHCECGCPPLAQLQVAAWYDRRPIINAERERLGFPYDEERTG